jgi:copper chaperone CopZ
MTTRTYPVPEVHCQHCVDAITGEVTRVPGVEGVRVDLDAKTVTVTGDSVDDDAVVAAIDEAGYAVTR